MDPPEGVAGRKLRAYLSYGIDQPHFPPSQSNRNERHQTQYRPCRRGWIRSRMVDIPTERKRILASGPGGHLPVLLPYLPVERVAARSGWHRSRLRQGALVG